jgi:hypothetical protein
MHAPSEPDAIFFVVFESKRWNYPIYCGTREAAVNEIGAKPLGCGYIARNQEHTSSLGS